MKVIDVEQGSEQWHRERCGLPTVSEFSRFITPAKGDYSSQAKGYIADLIVESVEGPQESYVSGYMERGRVLEDEARLEYEFENDVEVVQVGLIVNHGAGYSPDGLIEPDGALEIKCPKSSTHVKWLLDGKLPFEHKPQVHGALYVGQLEWLDFVSYCPGYPTLTIRVTPDEYTAKVADALDRFIADHIKAENQIIGVSEAA